MEDDVDNNKGNWMMDILYMVISTANGVLSAEPIRE